VKLENEAPLVIQDLLALLDCLVKKDPWVREVCQAWMVLLARLVLQDLKDLRVNREKKDQ
jgi:hypothetical protein